MKLQTSLLSLVACVLLPAIAFAQEAPRDPATKEKKKAGVAATAERERKPRTTLAVTQIQGARVKNQQGDQLGRVEKIIADRDTGNIRLVLVSVGGFLGIGEKLVAVPWSALHTARRGNDLILDASREDLQTAPAVKDSALSQASYKKWLDWGNSYFGPERKGRTRTAEPVGKKEPKKAAAKKPAEPEEKPAPQRKAATETKKTPRPETRPAAGKPTPAEATPTPKATPAPKATPTPKPPAGAAAEKPAPAKATPTPEPTAGAPAAM